MKSLSDLVAQAESIATNLEDDEIPHIQRSIEQLRQRGGQLTYNRGAQNDIKAAKLLGNKVGYELSAGLSKTIESLQILSSQENESESNIVDIPGFLKKERETAILTSINIARKNTAKDCYKRCEMAKNVWWKEEKNKILSLLSNGDKLPYLVNSCSQKSFSRQGNEAHLSGRLGKEEASYARQISLFLDEVLNESIANTPKHLPVFLLEDDLSPLKSGKCPEIGEIARLISRYCSLSPSHDLSEQRQSDGELSKKMVSIALNHLEQEFFEYIRQYVDSFITMSSMSHRQMLVKFLESRMLPQIRSNDGVSFEDGCIDRVPVWPLIYLCLRSGLTNEAVEVANDAANNLGDWQHYLHEYVSQGRLSPENVRKISTEYKRSVRNSTDGCKRLVYSLIGGCDHEDNHPQVLLSVDDFMWLRLSHLHRSNCEKEGAHISMLSRSMDLSSSPSLPQLQRLVSEEYGEAHFQADRQPATYCKLLLLCQMLEPAMALLARHESLRCHAVHLAVLLSHRGLLLMPASISAPLLVREGGPHAPPRLNLARLASIYSGQFEAAHPREALDLFYLLADVPNEGGEPVFVAMATALALEDGLREAVLLGRPGSPGLIHRYGRDAASAVLNAVTDRLMHAGRTEAAVDLLQASGQDLEAADLLGELLAASLAASGGEGADVTRLATKAALLQRSLPTSQSEATLDRLVAVATFLQLAALGDAEAGLSALDRTGLLPPPDGVAPAVAAFRLLPEAVRALVPVVMAATMRLLRAAAARRPSSEAGLVDVRRRAAALVTFAGQLHYRMPADVYAGLSQLELDLS